MPRPEYVRVMFEIEYTVPNTPEAIEAAQQRIHDNVVACVMKGVVWDEIEQVPGGTPSNFHPDEWPEINWEEDTDNG